MTLSVAADLNHKPNQPTHFWRNIKENSVFYLFSLIRMLCAITGKAVSRRKKIENVECALVISSNEKKKIGPLFMDARLIFLLKESQQQ